MWNDSSFHRWCISSTQHLVLLSLYTVLNLILVFAINLICIFSYVHLQYTKKVSLCTFVFQFCLWTCLWPTWYFPLKSMKVFIYVSLPVPVLLYICLPRLVWPFTLLRNLIVISIYSHVKPCILYSHNLSQTTGIDLVLHYSFCFVVAFLIILVLR